MRNFGLFAYSVLASDIDDIQTTIELSDSVRFDNANLTENFILICDEEVMLCTSRVGTTCTVERGYEGTTATAHSEGATIKHGPVPSDIETLMEKLSSPTGGKFVKSTADGNTQETSYDETSFENAGAVANHETTYDHTKLHNQNTDQYLDYGGANQTSAAETRGHIDSTSNPHSTSVENLTDTEITSPSNGEVLSYNETSGKWENSSVTATTDEKVKVSSNDTTSGYLNGKLVAGSGISLTEGNDGGDETLTVENTDTGSSAVSTHEATYDHTKLHDQNTDQYLDYGGANQTNVTEVREHIDSSANPHNVTKDQVGLGNLTNDAQLKRAAADFDSFTEKSTLDDDDLILIEDSSDTLNKKKIPMGTLFRATRAVEFIIDNNGNVVVDSNGNPVITNSVIYLGTWSDGTRDYIASFHQTANEFKSVEVN